jgi:hypothetical protein
MKDWTPGFGLPAAARDFMFYSLDWFWGTPSVLYNGNYWDFFSLFMKLTTHLHLMLRLRMLELCLHFP